MEVFLVVDHQVGEVEYLEVEDRLQVQVKNNA